MSAWLNADNVGRISAQEYSLDGYLAYGQLLELSCWETTESCIQPHDQGISWKQLKEVEADKS